MSRRIRIFSLPMLVVALAGADPMPYDSIGNPLNKLPTSDKTVQLKGDSLNLVPNRVRVNQAGYRHMDVVAGYAKFYCVGCAGSTFSVVNGNGVAVATGSLAPKGATVSGQVVAYASNSAEHAHNGEGDWKKGYPLTGKVVSGALYQGILPATVPPGRYVVRVGSDSSVPFVVSDNVYGMARDAAIKFFGVARSGDYESWFHPASHTWDGWLYDSTAKNPDGTYKYKGALKGGWYDCGNHLKEARTNSFPLATLGMLAATMPEKDADRYALNQSITSSTDRIPDVLREAWVGAQFVFNSWRLAKGVASDMYLSVGDLSWDFAWWGRPENHDAVLNLTRGGRRERVLKRDWGSASMADFAAGLAFLSRLYRPYDQAQADSALVIARAMYQAAQTANKKEESEDYSADNFAFDDLGLAAVALLWATGESKYLDDAVFAKGLKDGVGGTCKSTTMSPDKQLRLFEGGFFACDPDDGMKKKGGPTDYTSVHSLALYSFAKLILVDPDTAARYGIRAGQRDTFLLRTITQMPGLWNQGAGSSIQIPTGDPYNTVSLTYDTTWYSMGIGYGKSGWWNKYQFGNLADLYMFYDMTGIVDGRAIVDKPGTTDWKRKEILQVLLGGLNYMFGTNALDLSYLYGIGRKNPMHPHHRAANPEGKNVPGAYYNYTIPVGGLYGGLMTGPANTEKLVEKFGGPVGQTEANCPDAQAVVMIPLMGLSKETPVGPPKPTVKILYTTDTMAVIQIDLDKWGTVTLGYGLDSAIAVQKTYVAGGDTAGTFKISIGALKPATQYWFHVIATDLQGRVSTTGKWPNGASDSIPFSFTTKAQAPGNPIYGNIKVCNVTSDSAEIMWYTPNGEFLSSVLFADTASWKASRFTVVDTDAVGGVPVKFHRVKLSGLKAKTTYWFKVGVPGVYGDVVGCFRTPGENVKFDIRTTRYEWDGKPALGLAVVNQDVKSYDSLQIRFYVNGTRANIVDLAARVDIAFAYRADGFADSGLFSHTKKVQDSRPRLIDTACNPDAGSCAWYFDLPLHGAVMETQARWRLDVVFDRHNLIRDSTNILNMAPTHDPFGGTDWSFRPHVAGGDGGMSPIDYPGVPEMSKNAIDSAAADIPVNPYIAVYRRNEFIYGYSPYAAEQATKRTVFAMTTTFDAPFDIGNGGTIQIGAGTATRLKGHIDPYDVMMPAVKGYITTIWVNGVALSEAERRAALTRQPDGTWKVDLPLRFTTGTNKLDVTFFAGSDSTESVSTGACDEGKGCAFGNFSWYVNYVSNMTPSIASVVDAADAIQDAVVPDSSFVRLRVNDGNANASKTVADVVNVVLLYPRTGVSVPFALTETGLNTGIFQTDLLKVVSTVAAAGQIQAAVGDTVVMRYVDAGDVSDTSYARFRVPSLFTPSALSVTDSLGIPQGLVVPDSSRLVLRVADRNAGKSPLAIDSVMVVVVDLRTGASDTAFLPETGANTGVFQSGVLGAVSAATDLAALRAIQTIPGDTLLARYVDASDPTDSSRALIWSVASWPLVSRAAIAAACGGTRVLDVQFDRTLLARGQTAPLPTDIASATVRLRTASGDTIAPWTPAAGGWSVTGVAFDHLYIPLPATVPFRSDWTGSVAVEVRDGKGGYKTVSGAITDVVGPWIDSARIVENLEGGAIDTISIWTSEELGSAPAIPVTIQRAGAAVAVASIDKFRLADSAANRWVLTLPAGIAKAGDSIALAATVLDARGNAALVCPDLRRRIGLTGRPASVSAAWIRDADGDARADQVVLVYKRPLRAEEVPDALVASFGSGDSLRAAAVSAKVGDSVVVVPLAAPFGIAETRGSGSDGSGRVSLSQAGVSLGSAPLSDSVGPALLKADLRYGSASDTLHLEFSETVASGVVGSWMQSISGVPVELAPKGLPVSVNGRIWSFPIDAFRVVPGDSVRPYPNGRFVDASGRATATMHPWVRVGGSERPPQAAWYKDVDGNGAVDQIVMRWARSPRQRPSFALLWPSIGGGFDTARVAADSWALQPDGLTAVLPIGPFDRGVTSSPTTDLGRQVSAGDVAPFAIQDSVPPVLLAAKLRYGASVGAADSLSLSFSERVMLDPATTGTVVKAVPQRDVSFGGAGGSADGVDWIVPVAADELVPGDSVRPSSATGFSDTAGNRPSPLHPWVYVDGSERPPQTAWYKDLDGDGAVDHVVVQWTRGPRTRPDLSFLWPNGAGGFDSTAVTGGAWSLDADGRTLTLPVGPFRTGVTSSSTTDLGRQNSAGTITSFPIHDSVPAVMTGARMGYASADGLPDTLHLSWSEPIVWSGASPLAFAQSKGLVSPVVGTATSVRADGLGGMILFDPDDSSLSVLRKGDLVRLAPKSAGTQTDRFGNAAEDPTRWVEVVLGRRPPRFQVVFDPNKIRYLDWPLDVGPALQIWVRARGEAVWTDFTTGLPVPAAQVVQGLGPTISLNQPLRGKAILYDNQGTYVAKVDLDLLYDMFRADLLPKDASNQYDVRVQWNGKTAKGKPAASGVYMMRLVLWQNLATENEAPDWRVVNNVYRLGWEVQAK